VKKFWKVAGIATLVAIVGVMLIGAVALAQDPEDGADWPFDFRAKLHQAIADALGIGVDEYDAAVQTAHDQVLDQAVAEGYLSQEQADQIRERAAEGFGPGMMGGGFFGPGSRSGAWGRGGHGMMGGAETSLVAIAAQGMARPSPTWQPSEARTCRPSPTPTWPSGPRGWTSWWPRSA